MASWHLCPHGLTCTAQAYGFSGEFDFYTPEPVGSNSTIHFLAIADLGQVTLDGSDEYDYDWSGDPLNEDATGTLMRVRLLAMPSGCGAVHEQVQEPVL